MSLWGFDWGSFNSVTKLSRWREYSASAATMRTFNICGRGSREVRSSRPCGGSTLTLRRALAAICFPGRLLRFHPHSHAGENVDLFEVKDPHTVSGLLKLYIRQLPEPLGTFEYYSDWLKASQGM